VDNQLLPSAEVLIKVKNLDKNKFTDDEWYFLTENVKSTKTMLNSRVIEFDEMF
jgi:hypothetical protein